MFETKRVRKKDVCQRQTDRERGGQQRVLENEGGRERERERKGEERG